MGDQKPPFDQVCNRLNTYRGSDQSLSGCVVVAGINRLDGPPFATVNGYAGPEQCAKFYAQPLQYGTYRFKEDSVAG